MQSKKDNYQLLVNGNLYKRICLLSIPTIISMLITAVYNAADTYFVSGFGESAIAGVSVVMSYMSIVQACGFFFGHGSGNYISKSLGAKNDKSAEQIAVTGLVYSFAFGLLISVISLIFIDELVAVLSNATMTEYTKGYFLYIILATPFMTSSFTINNQLRFQGNAVYGMVGMGVGAVLNIILDPIFIKLFNGVHGASIATMLSQIIGFIILFVGTFYGGNIRFRIKNFRFSKLFIFEIIKGGAPSLLRQGMASVATVILTLVVKGYGDYAIAGISIAQKIAHIIFSILLGFGQGFQPVCGFNYGAKKYDRVIKSFWFTTFIATIYLIVATVLCTVFAGPLVAIFNQNNSGLSSENMQKALELAERVLRYQAFAFPISGFYVASNMMMQNIGRPIRASILALCRQGIVYIPILFIFWGSFGLFGIEIVQTVSDLISFLISIPILISVMMEIKRLKNITGE